MRIWHSCALALSLTVARNSMVCTANAGPRLARHHWPEDGGFLEAASADIRRPKPSASAGDVVTAQMNALQAGDAMRAFKLMSPANKAVTGPWRRFKAMIEQTQNIDRCSRARAGSSWACSGTTKEGGARARLPGGRVVGAVRRADARDRVHLQPSKAGVTDAGEWAGLPSPGAGARTRTWSSTMGGSAHAERVAYIPGISGSGADVGRLAVVLAAAAAAPNPEAAARNRAEEAASRRQEAAAGPAAGRRPTRTCVVSDRGDGVEPSVVASRRSKGIEGREDAASELRHLRVGVDHAVRPAHKGRSCRARHAAAAAPPA